MEKVIEYITDLIKILEATLIQLKDLKQKATTGLEEEGKLYDMVKQTAEDVRAIKKGVIG